MTSTLSKSKKEITSLKDAFKKAPVYKPEQAAVFKEVTPEPADEEKALYPVGTRTGLTVGEIPKVQKAAAKGVPLGVIAKDFRITVSVLKKFL